MSPGLTAITTRSEPLTSSRFEVATATPALGQTFDRRRDGIGDSDPLDHGGSALIQLLDHGGAHVSRATRPIRLMLMTG